MAAFRVICTTQTQGVVGIAFERGGGFERCVATVSDDDPLRQTCWKPCLPTGGPSLCDKHYREMIGARAASP